MMRYHYRVGGKDYEGDGFKIGGKTRAGGLIAKALIKKYPEGRDVDVYYDPADPAHSSLEEKGSVTRPTILVFFVVFAAIAGILTAHAIAGKMIMMSNGLPMFALGLPSAALLVAVGAVVAYFNQRRDFKASASWPAIPGKIVSSNIIEDTETAPRRRWSRNPEHDLSPRHSLRLQHRRCRLHDGYVEARRHRGLRFAEICARRRRPFSGWPSRDGLLQSGVTRCRRARSRQPRRRVDAADLRSGVWSGRHRVHVAVHPRPLGQCGDGSVIVTRSPDGVKRNPGLASRDRRPGLRFAPPGYVTFTRPQISISVPNSTTCLVGTPKNAAERSALRCRNANIVSRHTHMPGISSLGIMVSRPM